jgi:uracil-DNA glycosylase
LKVIIAFVTEEQKQYTVYPPEALVFNAFDKTGFEEVKVVILGQDPYTWLRSGARFKLFGS